VVTCGADLLTAFFDGNGRAFCAGFLASEMLAQQVLLSGRDVENCSQRALRTTTPPPHQLSSNHDSAAKESNAFP
jgi:hypothetical protein